MHFPSKFRSLILALAIVPALAGCDDGSPQAAAGAEMPPTAVSVVEVAPADIPILNELPGRIAPTRIAEVRPRVSGIVVERVFEQGSTVKQGDVLYRIDPEPFRVEVEAARATLERAEAARVQARQEADRQRALRQRNVSSGQQYDNAVAALAQADADVAAAKANLAAAELNLRYSEVTAPISGRIGRAQITEGALIDSTDVLATIQQLDPVYADFTQSANDLLRLKRAAEAGLLTSPNPGEAVVQLLLDDGTPYSHQGRLLFSEAAVDATTGQVTLRGEFPNPDGDLLPGMYVRVRIEQGVQANAIAVPQQAVQRGPDGRAQVYVVNDQGAAEIRPVVTGRTVDNLWVIESGLQAGDTIIVEGFQKIGPGAPVTPVPWESEAAASRGLAAGGAASRNAG
jgi:membrane fusion protein (multidrug efflux system)